MSSSVKVPISHMMREETCEDQKIIKVEEIKKVRAQYSLKEVANHDSWDDCWIIIYDRVYDVTKFLGLHPGGDDLMMEYAGRDASLAFRGTGHSQEATNMLKQYEIGELPPHEQIYRCESGKLSFTETFIL